MAKRRDKGKHICSNGKEKQQIKVSLWWLNIHLICILILDTFILRDTTIKYTVNIGGKKGLRVWWSFQANENWWYHGFLKIWGKKMGKKQSTNLHLSRCLLQIVIHNFKLTSSKVCVTLNNNGLKLSIHAIATIVKVNKKVTWDISL